MFSTPKLFTRETHFESRPEICSNVSTKLEGKFFEVDSTHFRFRMIDVLLQTPSGYITFQTSQMVHSSIKCE
jgi:hypothetical protein